MALAPRVVVVYRRSELEELTERHATRGQVEFFLELRGQTLASAEIADQEAKGAHREIAAGIPADWRRADVEREDLPSFLFGPEDVVAVVGRDGLVANVAKYVDHQPVVGFNPYPHSNAGVLTPFVPEHAASLLPAVVAGNVDVIERTKVVAETDDGQHIEALNDLYIGDEGHQSARYEISQRGHPPETQSSSGVVVGTGTGATGWLASLASDRNLAALLPGPADASLAWFVREAWPSPFTSVELTSGVIGTKEHLSVTVRSECLVVFGDGIEHDRLEVTHGQQVAVRVAERRLRWVAPRTR